MEGQLIKNLNFGMSEIFVIGSIYLYQQTFAFSLVLLILGLLGKLLGYGIILQEKKAEQEASSKLIESVVENIAGALAISNMGKKKDGGFH